MEMRRDLRDDVLDHLKRIKTIIESAEGPTNEQCVESSNRCVSISSSFVRHHIEIASSAEA